MAGTVLVPIAQGTEEIEAVTVIDLLRRAGVYVKVAGDSGIINCSRGVKIIPDVKIDDIDSDDNFEAIVLPGGNLGTQRLMENPVIEDIIRNLNKRGRIIAAVCAAPTILAMHRILTESTMITSHPSVKQQLARYNYSEENVVVSNNIITSRGAGTTIEFALKIIEILVNKETSDKIAVDICFK